MIAVIIFGLCALTSAACAVLLSRMYLRRRLRLLLWCAFGFFGLALNNVLLFADKIVFVEQDLSMARAATVTLGLAAMCFGLIWDAEQ